MSGHSLPQEEMMVYLVHLGVCGGACIFPTGSNELIPGKFRGQIPREARVRRSLLSTSAPVFEMPALAHSD